MNIPVHSAKKLNPDLADPLSQSHVYIQKKELSSRYFDFEIPFATDITWTDLFIRQIVDHPIQATLCLSVSDLSPLVLAAPFEIQNGQWASLPWPIPSVPLRNQTLLLRLDLGSVQPYYVNIQLLGFHKLLEEKEEYAFADKQGLYRICLRCSESEPGFAFHRINQGGLALLSTINA